MKSVNLQYIISPSSSKSSKFFCLKLRPVFIIKSSFICMVVKTMTEQQNCQDCSQKDKCREIYPKPANFQGRPMVVSVIIAFVLPIVIFIISLATFERVFAQIISSKQSRTAIGFLVAISITLFVILLAKVINRQIEKNK